MATPNEINVFASDRLTHGLNVPDVANELITKFDLLPAQAFDIADRQALLLLRHAPEPVTPVIKQSPTQIAPEQSTPAPASDDFIDDAELSRRIDGLIAEGKTDAEIKTQLAPEVAGDI